MIAAPLPLVLFEDKIPVDKNFSFSTKTIAGHQAFKIDLEKSYEEKPEVIIDTMSFVNKLHYDSPLVNTPFGIKEYCSVLGKSINAFRHENIVEDDPMKRWTNKIERVLYKLLNRNMIRESTFEIPSKKKKVETFERISLLNMYSKVSDDEKKDKRKVEYVAELSDYMKDNLSSFLFYTSSNDYRILVKTYYRNPNYRFLYMRLAALLNNLKAGIDDHVSFDELLFILGYDKETKFGHSKAQVISSVNKLLMLDSLRGLTFRMAANGNGISAIPVFLLGDDHRSNLLTETKEDKHKRLDLLVLTRLKKVLPPIKNGSYAYFDVRHFMGISAAVIIPILNECYLAVMRKEPTTEQIGLFINHYVYKDDYGNVYASNLVRHIICNGEPLANDTDYRKSTVKLL